MTRREFLEALAAGLAAGLPLGAAAADGRDLYALPRRRGKVTLLHFTDCHAQLLPVHFREPDVNIGVGPARGKPPHLVGEVREHRALRRVAEHGDGHKLARVGGGDHDLAEVCERAPPAARIAADGEGHPLESGGRRHRPHDHLGQADGRLAQPEEGGPPAHLCPDGLHDRRVGVADRNGGIRHSR